jgi:hypothetical protein
MNRPINEVYLELFQETQRFISNGQLHNLVAEPRGQYEVLL